MSLTAGDKVAEIFKFAGQAFIKLGELTSSFDKQEEDLSVDKWDEEDIETLKRTIRTFSEELNSLSENLKKKAISNMKQGMKRRVNASKGLTHVTSSPSKTPKVVKSSDA